MEEKKKPENPPIKTARGNPGNDEDCKKVGLYREVQTSRRVGENALTQGEEGLEESTMKIPRGRGKAEKGASREAKSRFPLPGG